MQMLSHFHSRGMFAKEVRFCSKLMEFPSINEANTISLNEIAVRQTPKAVTTLPTRQYDVISEVGNRNDTDMTETQLENAGEGSLAEYDTFRALKTSSETVTAVLSHFPIETIHDPHLYIPQTDRKAPGDWTQTNWRPFTSQFSGLEAAQRAPSSVIHHHRRALRGQDHI